LIAATAGLGVLSAGPVLFAHPLFIHVLSVVMAAASRHKAPQGDSMLNYARLNKPLIFIIMWNIRRRVRAEVILIAHMPLRSTIAAGMSPARSLLPEKTIRLL